MSSIIRNLTKNNKKNNQKGFIVPILIAIIALLVIGGGVYTYQKAKINPVVLDPQPTQSVLSTSLESSICGKDGETISGKIDKCCSGFHPASLRTDGGFGGLFECVKDATSSVKFTK